MPGDLPRRDCGRINPPAQPPGRTLPQTQSGRLHSEPECGLPDWPAAEVPAYACGSAALRGDWLSQMDNLKLAPLPCEIFCNQPAVAVVGLVLTA